MAQDSAQHMPGYLWLISLQSSAQLATKSPGPAWMSEQLTQGTGLAEVVSNPLQPCSQAGVVSHCTYSLLTWLYLTQTDTTARLPSFPKPQLKMMILEFFPSKLIFDNGKKNGAVFRHCRIVFLFNLAALLVRAISAAAQNHVSGDTLQPAWLCPVLPGGLWVRFLEHKIF